MPFQPGAVAGVRWPNWMRVVMRWALVLSGAETATGSVSGAV
ncbi:hypothetical protein [Planomonospora algeriensis]